VRLLADKPMLSASWTKLDLVEPVHLLGTCGQRPRPSLLASERPVIPNPPPPPLRGQGIASIQDFDALASQQV